MQILYLIISGVLFSTSILFFILYLKMKNKLSKTNVILQEYKSLANSSNRIGFYQHSVNLTDKPGGTGLTYDCILYVKELDTYTNGMSKIELTKVELISGFDSTQFEHVKNVMRTKFPSLRKTADIEWLESEDSIKENRRLKLEKIKNLENNK